MYRPTQEREEFKPALETNVGQPIMGSLIRSGQSKTGSLFRYKNAVTESLLPSVDIFIIDNDKKDNRSELIKKMPAPILSLSSPSMYSKDIRNNEPYRWLDWIEDGSKKYEGRLARRFWLTLKKNDIVTWFDDKDKFVTTKIVDIIKYTDFGAAFDELGSKLVPIPGITRDEVVKMYNDIFEEDTSKYGVLAIKLKVLHY